MSIKGAECAACVYRGSVCMVEVSRQVGCIGSPSKMLVVGAGAGGGLPNLLLSVGG